MSSSVNPPQALNAVLAATPQLAAIMQQGIPLAYTLPIATPTVLGGVKIGANVTVQPDGTISVAPPSSYTLPIASAAVLGGIKVGANLSIAGDGTLSATGGGAVSSVFTRSGAVVAQAGDYTAAQVTNAVDQTQTYSNPGWITALPWTKVTGAPTFQQNPAIADELQGGFRTLNSGNVGVGNSLATAPMTSPGNYVQVGSDSGTTVGHVVLCSNGAASNTAVGELDFVNFVNPGADKRVAYIQGVAYLSAGTSGYLSFFTANAAAAAERMRISPSGQYQVGYQIYNPTNDFFAFQSNAANQGLGICSNVAAGGCISLRSNGTVNYIQSGNYQWNAAQDLRISSWNATTTWMTFQASSNVVAYTCPTAASDTALMANNMVYCYINEAGNALTFRVKFSSGTIKQGTITVA